MSDMTEFCKLLDSFVQQSINILGNNLTGIYLHGSAVMGCFRSSKSDLDLLIVVKEDIPKETKHQYMDMVVLHNKQAPAKGLELSILQERACNPFVYPTPFVLHFSPAHLNWYNHAPEAYLENMQGTDKDLAAHVTILLHRGKTLYGKEISTVFGDVRSEDYFDSICCDVAAAREDILLQPMYVTLNLCRVLAYKKEAAIFSKLEGGKWGISHVPQKYRTLIADAVAEYQRDVPMVLDRPLAQEFADYMLRKIGVCKNSCAT